MEEINRSRFNTETYIIYESENKLSWRAYAGEYRRTNDE